MMFGLFRSWPRHAGSQQVSLPPSVKAGNFLLAREIDAHASRQREPAHPNDPLTPDPHEALVEIGMAADSLIATLYEPDLQGWRVANARPQIIRQLQYIRRQAAYATGQPVP